MRLLKGPESLRARAAIRLSFGEIADGIDTVLDAQQPRRARASHLSNVRPFVPVPNMDDAAALAEDLVRLGGDMYKAIQSVGNESDEPEQESEGEAREGGSSTEPASAAGSHQSR